MLLATKLSLDSIQKTNYIELLEIGKSIMLNNTVKIEKIQNAPGSLILRNVLLRSFAYKDYSRN